MIDRRHVISGEKNEGAQGDKFYDKKKIRP